MPSIPSAPIYDVASLLPHSGHMVLIDCVKEFGDDYTVCRAPVGDKHILLQDGVLPSMAYMELMAQGIGAFAGIEALKAGEPVRLGFLLGTRKLDLFADSVPVGTELEIRAPCVHSGFGRHGRIRLRVALDGCAGRCEASVAAGRLLAKLL